MWTCFSPRVSDRRETQGEHASQRDRGGNGRRSPFGVDTLDLSGKKDQYSELSQPLT